MQTLKSKLEFPILNPSICQKYLQLIDVSFQYRVWALRGIRLFGCPSIHPSDNLSGLLLTDRLTIRLFIRLCVGLHFFVLWYLWPLLITWFDFDPSNYMPIKMWEEITYSYWKVLEWISNFISNFIMGVISYPCWDSSCIFCHFLCLCLLPYFALYKIHMNMNTIYSRSIITNICL